MKIQKPKTSNIVFIIALAFLIIPQTRKPIQVFLNKGLTLFSPSVIDKDKSKKLVDYDWNLIDESSASFNLREAKGKVLIINFWATWCPPCIAEMESLQKLYNTFSSNEEVEFLFVTHDPFKKINTFKEKENYSFPAYRQITKEPNVFNVSSIPRTFIIDKEGNILVDKTGASNWSSKKVVKLIERLVEN